MGCKSARADRAGPLLKLFMSVARRNQVYKTLMTNSDRPAAVVKTCETNLAVFWCRHIDLR